MSHFSILVVGSVDYQMAPFHEYECDGIDDEFIQDIDRTEEARKEYEERKASNEDIARMSFLEFVQDWYGDRPVLKSEDEINTDAEEQKWGYIIVDKDGEVLKVIKRTNPNSFYDYYTDGYNAFKLKSSGLCVNHARKGEIDFDTMFKDREEGARERYRKVMKLLGFKKGEIPVLEHTWNSLVDKFHPNEGKPTMTKDEAREIYEAQKLVKKWNEIPMRDRMNLVGLFGGVDDFCMSEDEYVASQSIHALSFGWVRNRKYHSRGDMGWWACVSNEKEATSWDKEYEDFLNSLPDDVELTMLDCHV